MFSNTGERLMAVWQFDVYLVPRRKISGVIESQGQRIHEEQFDATSWWAGNDLPPGYRELLAALLPRAASWSPAVELWGEEAGNRIDIARDAEALDEVRARLDVRQLDTGFVEGLARFAATADCCFITEEFEVIPPDAGALLKEAKNSSAYRFVLDPQAFLEEGNREGTES
jgi:hypothetical protein